MKQRFLSLAFVAAMVLAVVAALRSPAAAETTPPGAIHVSGEAEVRVVPDEVVLTLGVETWDKNLSVAKAQNDAIVKKALALTEELGIPSEHVQTDYIGIDPRYRLGTYDEKDFIGYFVYKTIAIRLRDLDKFEPLLTKALEAGVNHVHGISFRTTELRKYRDQARALAIRAAREKAEALAAELGNGIGRATSVQEEQSSWWSGYGAWWGSSWGGAMSQNVVQEYGGSPLGLDSSVAPGQISIRATVSVSFELTS